MAERGEAERDTGHGKGPKQHGKDTTRKAKEVPEAATASTETHVLIPALCGEDDEEEEEGGRYLAAACSQ
jgi:hypothetical protein